MHQELERHERAATDLKKRGAQLNRNRPALGRIRRRTSLTCTSPSTTRCIASKNDILLYHIVW